MNVLLEGEKAERATALTDLDALISAAPDEFHGWIVDLSPWVKAQITDDRAALERSVEASNEAVYQISNRCQFVLADM